VTSADGRERSAGTDESLGRKTSAPGGSEKKLTNREKTALPRGDRLRSKYGKRETDVGGKVWVLNNSSEGEGVLARLRGRGEK